MEKIQQVNNLQNEINDLNRQLNEANNEIIGLRNQIEKIEEERDNRPNITFDR